MRVTPFVRVPEPTTVEATQSESAATVACASEQVPPLSSLAPTTQTESMSKRRLEAGGAPAGSTTRQFSMQVAGSIANPALVRGTDAWEAEAAALGIRPDTLAFFRIGNNTVVTLDRPGGWLFERRYDAQEIPALTAVEAHLRKALLAGFVTMAARDAGLSLLGECLRPEIAGKPYWTGFVVATETGGQIALVLPNNPEFYASAAIPKAEPALFASGEVSTAQIEALLASILRDVTPAILAKYETNHP